MAAAMFSRSVFRCRKQIGPYLNKYLRCNTHRRKYLEANIVTGSARSYGSHHNYPMPDIPSKEVARSFVVNLDDAGRSYLYKELLSFEKRQLKAGVSPRFTKATKPKKVEDRSEQKGAPVDVTRSQLCKVFMFNGIPFLGFGLLDNLIMIVAGEYIDATLGLALGISTMAAAALGNLISDVIGVGTAGYVEVLASKIGIVSPDMTPEQADYWQTRWMIGLGRAVGISVGCVIGMFPLLFISRDREDEAEGTSVVQSSQQSTETPSGESSENSSETLNVQSSQLATKSTSIDSGGTMESK